jgi:hypothetical protein
MIVIAKPIARAARRTIAKKNDAANCQEQFLALLPAIRRHAQVRFRHLDSESREDAIASVVAHTWDFFIKLVSLGREGLAFAGPLARYGVARFHSGRQVGNKLNVRDITSTWCQQSMGVRVESLINRDPTNGEWQQLLVEDRNALPSDIAVMRIDFRAWLKTLSPSQRRVAEHLATGERTQVVARMLQVSNGRISQMRAELERAWLSFQGETPTESPTTSACA